jgi:hypothetical protein
MERRGDVGVADRGDVPIAVDGELSRRRAAN